jgi:hypothetical protein
MRMVLLTFAAVAAVFGFAGFAIGSTGIAPWRHTAPSYSCHGYQGAAWCRLRGSPYEAFVTKGRVAIFSQGEAIFGCINVYGDPNDDCNDYR